MRLVRFVPQRICYEPHKRHRVVRTGRMPVVCTAATAAHSVVASIPSMAAFGRPAHLPLLLRATRGGDGTTDRSQTSSDLRRPSQHSVFRRAFGTGQGPKVLDAACGLPAATGAAVLQTAPFTATITTSRFCGLVWARIRHTRRDRPPRDGLELADKDRPVRSPRCERVAGRSVRHPGRSTCRERQLGTNTGLCGCCRLPLPLGDTYSSTTRYTGTLDSRSIASRMSSAAGFTLSVTSSRYVPYSLMSSRSRGLRREMSAARVGRKAM